MVVIVRTPHTFPLFYRTFAKYYKYSPVTTRQNRLFVIQANWKFDQPINRKKKNQNKKKAGKLGFYTVQLFDENSGEFLKNDSNFLEVLKIRNFYYLFEMFLKNREGQVIQYIARVRALRLDQSISHRCNLHLLSLPCVKHLLSIE